MVHPLLPLFLFLGAILLEIFGFAWVGGAVGALSTVALVVITAVIGLWIFRLQGVAHWQRMQGMLQRGELPARDLLEGWLLMLAAVLLLVPGFFSDAAGFLLLVPPLRTRVATWLLGRRGVWVAAARRAGPDAGDTIEGEYRRRQDDDTERLDDHRDR
ncbi:FxsA family protein [Thioalkalivibrio nitratireducens]|nr:FxsA family protein [Thioalkalivibrio nitratireducens]